MIFDFYRHNLFLNFALGRLCESTFWRSIWKLLPFFQRSLCQAQKIIEILKLRLNISGQKFHISGSGVSQVIVIYNNCGCWFLAQWSAGKVMSAVAGQWPERKYRERHKYVGNRRNLWNYWWYIIVQKLRKKQRTLGTFSSGKTAVLLDFVQIQNVYISWKSASNL